MAPLSLLLLVSLDILATVTISASASSFDLTGRRSFSSSASASSSFPPISPSWDFPATSRLSKPLRKSRQTPQPSNTNDAFAYQPLRPNEWTPFYFGEVGEPPFSRWEFTVSPGSRCKLQVVDAYCVGDYFEVNRVSNRNPRIEETILTTPPVPYNSTVAAQLRNGQDVTCKPLTDDPNVSWGNPVWSQGQTGYLSPRRYRIIIKPLLAPYGSGGAFVRLSCHSGDSCSSSSSSSNAYRKSRRSHKPQGQPASATKQSEPSVSQSSTPLDSCAASSRKFGRQSSSQTSDSASSHASSSSSSSARSSSFYSSFGSSFDVSSSSSSNANVCTYGSSTIKMLTRGYAPFSRQLLACASAGYKPFHMTSKNSKEAGIVLFTCAGGSAGKAWIASYKGDDKDGAVGLLLNAPSQPGGEPSITPVRDDLALNAVLCFDSK